MQKTIVIKLGTSVLTNGSRKLDTARMIELVQQCACIKEAGHNVIIVTSGAIAAGRELLGYPDLPVGIAYKQLLAAVGQGKLIQQWEQLFSIYTIFIGQMLVTRADLEHKERFLNARDVLLALLEQKIIPIINENDAVATAEIKVGDNDNLSALVAVLARADMLILLTDIDGLYTANPQNDSTAKFIPHVHAIDDSVYAMASGSQSGLGTGGMTTKIEAAEIACGAGIDVIIANGALEKVVVRAVAGEEVGTHFHAAEKTFEERKQWLFGAPVAGKVLIDQGAAKALLQQGGSLLPIGIVQAEGLFSRGEVISICDAQGKDLAHGVARYNSEDLRQIVGKKSTAIFTILGYEHGTVAVHRDDMVLVKKF